MNKLTPLLAIMLLVLSSFVWAEADSSADLRYCLDLPSVQQIAKCAGEISAGNKGRTFSKKEVERILSEEKATVPASASDLPGSPATVSDKPNKDLLLEKSESNGN